MPLHHASYSLLQCSFSFCETPILACRSHLLRAMCFLTGAEDVVWQNIIYIFIIIHFAEVEQISLFKCKAFLPEKVDSLRKGTS